MSFDFIFQSATSLANYVGGEKIYCGLAICFAYLMYRRVLFYHPFSAMIFLVLPFILKFTPNSFSHIFAHHSAYISVPTMCVVLSFVMMLHRMLRQYLWVLSPFRFMRSAKMMILFIGVIYLAFTNPSMLSDAFKYLTEHPIIAACCLLPILSTLFYTIRPFVPLASLAGIAIFSIGFFTEGKRISDINVMKIANSIPTDFSSLSKSVGGLSSGITKNIGSGINIKSAGKSVAGWGAGNFDSLKSSRFFH